MNLFAPATLAQSETFSTITNYNPIYKELGSSNTGVDVLVTRKVDLDYIPGLDDADLKVILPGIYQIN